MQKQEFINHMIAETPFTILSIRDPTQIEKLSISMSNGGYDSVSFGHLFLQ